MIKFDGFSEETIEILLGIRFNNNKEWFNAHKYSYNQQVHEPMLKFSNELYEKIKSVHPDFIDTPRVCRVNRDIRFSKNKEPYKESKWFFLREGNISTIQYVKPNYFFEIRPEYYLYGLGFWAEPKVMNRFREYARINPRALQDMVDIYKSQNIFELTGDAYKNKFQNIIAGDLNEWFIKKEFTFISQNPIDNVLYSASLVDKVYNDLMILYPIYEFFSFIVKDVSLPDPTIRR